MKKPDIIYVHRGLHLGMLTTTVIKVGAHDEEEYIRKDALLEWIDEYKNYSSGPSWELLKTHIETL